MDYHCKECAHVWEIEVEFIRGSPPQLYGLPENCDPGSPDELCILDSQDKCPNCSTLADDERALELMLEKHEYGRDDE